MQLFGMEEHKHHMKLNKDAFFIIIERRRRIISAVWNNERRFVSWLSIKICHPTINPRAGTKHNNPHRHHHSSSDSPSPPAGQPTNHAEIEIGIEILRFEIKNRPRTPPPPPSSHLCWWGEKRREEKRRLRRTTLQLRPKKPTWKDWRSTSPCRKYDKGRVNEREGCERSDDNVLSGAEARGAAMGSGAYLLMSSRWSSKSTISCHFSEEM